MYDSDRPTSVCPHCGRGIDNSRYMLHVKACPEGADAAALVVQCMTDPAAPGMARSTKQYNAARAALSMTLPLDRDLPPTAYTMTQVYGSWVAACERFGLTAPPANNIAHAIRGRAERAARKDAAVGAEIDAAIEANRAAAALARYEAEHGLTVATHGDGVTRGDGTPYARRLPSGGGAYMLK